MGFKNKTIAALTLVFVISTSVWADEVSNTQELSTPTDNSRELSAQPGTAQDWGLTSQEWQHYQQLMQGADGLWYARLSPPAILGMRADTKEEQQHFAELVAKQEHDKVARELAFNNAVWVAMRNLYPDEPMIRDFDKTPFNPGKATQKNNGIALQPGDRLVLFEDTQRLDMAVLPKLLAILQTYPKVNLDIFCLGEADDNAIRQWVSLNHVPASLVKSGRITLNQDGGRLEKTSRNAKLPYLLLLRNGQSKPVSIWDL